MALDLASTLSRAVALFRSGQLAEAADACAAVLAREPGSFDAIHLLGVVRGKQGRLEEAAELLTRAAERNPNSFEAHKNLALALGRLGRREAAVASNRRALALRPEAAEAWVELGNDYRALGREEDAVASYRRALALKPDDARTHNSLGNALKALGRGQEAVASYRAGLAVGPQVATLHYNLGAELEVQGQLDEAMACYRRALALKPDYGEASNNLGNALSALERHEEAIEVFERALALRPNYAQAHYNLGLALKALSRHEEAIACFRRAGELIPDFANAHWNESLTRLGAGDFAGGWAKYEWRWKRGDSQRNKRNFPQPTWLGQEPLAGKTILLHAEQGLGDTIQFARYAPLVAQRGGRVILEVQPPMRRLVEGLAGVERIVTKGEKLPEFDLHCPLLSLPLAMATTVATIPAAVPYLAAPADLVDAARARLRAWAGKVFVGLAWQGNPAQRSDKRRSIPLARLEALLGTPGVQFVSLQRDLNEEERRVVARAGNVIHFGDGFDATAALVQALDLVISVDTAWAHWAGAVARPVWVMLAYSPDWRWLRERADSPWYPTARLFRQQRLGDWDDVVGRVRHSLAEFVAARPAPPVAAVPEPPSFARAADLFRGSDHAGAAAMCGQILQADPGNFAALHLLGAVYGAQGKTAEAVATLGRAVAINPQSAHAQRNLAIAQGRAGEHEQAAASYRAAIAINPDFAEAHHGLGTELNALGRPAEAEASLRRAVEIKPDHAGAWIALANTLVRLARHGDAAAAFRSAIALKPRDAGLHNDLGNALKASDRVDESIVAYRDALALMPDLAEVHYNLGVALETQQKAEEAESCYRRALALKPGLPEANNNLGNRLGSLGDYEQAIAFYHKAIAARPDYAEAHYNLGIALLKLNRHEESIAAFDRAVAINPEYYNAHWNQSLAMLGAGDYVRGWPKYEWRQKRTGPETFNRNFGPPQWLGEDSIAGKTILLHAEQGLGDTIQFIRYVPAVAERGGRVLLEVQPVLKRLLAGVPGVAKIVGRGEPLPLFDCHCPLLSLPRAFATVLETIPARVPYLHTPPELKGTAAEILRRRAGEVLVGLAWKGNTQNRGDRVRSIELDQLLPRLAVPGVRLVSLQKDLTDAERAMIERSGQMVHPGRSFEDTAAIVEGLDLVISVDTSWAHWAGAVGRPLWVMLAFSPDWRWLREREDSPWYPTARLFRQRARGDWDEVIVRVRGALEDFVAGRRPRQPSLPPGRAALLRAVELHRRGQIALAVAQCAQALAAQPDDFDTVHLAGVLSGEQGRLDDAVAHLARAAALNPRSGAVLRNLAIAQEKLTRPEAAAETYRRLLALEPANPDALNGLALALLSLGRHAEAIEFYRQAVAVRPDLASAHNNLSAALAHLGRNEEAAESARAAIAIDPSRSEAHLNLGNALQALGRHEEALASLERAVALKPDSDAAHNAMGNACASLKRFESAIACYERALAIAPDNPNALGGLAHNKQRICDWRDFGRVAAAVLDHIRTRQSPIAPFTVLAMFDDPETQLACARRSHPQTTVPRSFPPQRRSGVRRRLRLGYLSADFHAHATAHLMAGLFERHDRARFELFAFSHGPDDRSPLRRRLERTFDSFIDVGRMTDDAVADRVFEREIDILIDLKGYTSGSRLGVLARRPAPVQVHYLGYPGTLGTDFVDYMIVDRFVVPPEQERNFTEKLVRLPDSYQVNDRDRAIAAGRPSRAACGLPADGFVFCCFNNNYKIMPEVFGIWLRLLQAVPGSVLWLLGDNAWAEANLRRTAAAAAIDPARLVFAPRVGPADHLARHALADLFIDTVPCNAHTTASDALWAGLPVLTCAGRSFAARVAGSLLHAVGLPELVTGNLADYEALALRLAREPSRLTQIRIKLAANRLTAPLFDTDRTRRQLEAAYLAMWERWQRGEAPQAFAVP